MWGGMIHAVITEASRQAIIQDAENERLKSRIAAGIDPDTAYSEMQKERDERCRNYRKLSEDMRQYAKPNQSFGNGIEPMYLLAAFMFGAAIG